MNNIFESVTKVAPLAVVLGGLTGCITVEGRPVFMGGAPVRASSGGQCSTTQGLVNGRLMTTARDCQERTSETVWRSLDGYNNIRVLQRQVCTTSWRLTDPNSTILQIVGRQCMVESEEAISPPPRQHYHSRPRGGSSCNILKDGFNCRRAELEGEDAQFADMSAYQQTLI